MRIPWEMLLRHSSFPLLVVVVKKAYPRAPPLPGVPMVDMGQSGTAASLRLHSHRRHLRIDRVGSEYTEFRGLIAAEARLSALRFGIIGPSGS